MKTKFLGFSLLAFLLLVSCDSGNIEDTSLENSLSKSSDKKDSQIELKANLPSESMIRELSIDWETVVEETPCEETELMEAFGNEVDAIFADPYAFGPYGLWAGLMLDVNQVNALLGEGPQYFGDNGQYTNYIKKDVRNLEKFWDMRDEISVRGQHTETLNDKDAIVAALTSVWFNEIPTDFAEAVADDMIANNALSDVLPESPLMASDGFATDLDGFLGFDDEIIVIGDGLVELVAGVGTDEKIAWTTILSHEWAHHIQFNNGYLDDYDLIFGNDPESTRAGELEADFIASYYMTHKRGATYNMKRIEQVLRNFFEIGDCGFTNPGHHGTPEQRMMASNLGSELAKSAQKNGKILSAEKVHAAFLDVYDEIVAVP